MQNLFEQQENQVQEPEVKNEQSADLVKVVETSGVEKSKAEMVLQKFSSFLEKARDWENKTNALVINDVSQVAEMKMARDARIGLKNGRCEMEKIAKSMRADVKAKMEGYLLEDKLIKSIYDTIETVYKTIENQLLEKEKFAENKEVERLRALKESRAIQLQEYGIDTQFIQLHTMPVEIFEKMLNDAKITHQAKIDAEKKAELDRIEQERKKKIFDDRKLELAPYIQFYNSELQGFIPLTIETSAQEFSMVMKNVKEEKEKYDAQQEKIMVENERLKKEKQQQQEKINSETELRNKRNAELKQFNYIHDFDIAMITENEFLEILSTAKGNFEKEQDRIKKDAEKQRKSKEAADKLLADQKTEAERLQAELDRKLKAEKEAEKQRIAAEKKAKAAPDKEKLTIFADQIDSIVCSDLKTDEAKKIQADAKAMLKRTSDYIRKEINSL